MGIKATSFFVHPFVEIPDKEEAQRERKRIYRNIVNAIRNYRGAIRQAWAIEHLALVAGARTETDDEGWACFAPCSPRSADVLHALFDTFEVRYKTYSTKTVKGEQVTTEKINTTIGLDFSRADGEVKFVRRGEIVSVPEKDVVSIERTPAKGHMYELRSFVMDLYSTTWKSFVWDIMRKEMSSRWRAKDPDLKITRSYAELVMARRCAQFMNVGLPILWAESQTGYVKFDNRRVTLNWDNAFGPVTLYIEGKKKGKGKDKKKPNRHSKLDWLRADILHKIQTGEYKLSTVYLKHTTDGKLKLTVPYHVPDSDKKLDAGRRMELTFSSNPEQLFELHQRDDRGVRTLVDLIWHGEFSAVAAVAWLDRLAAITRNLKRERAACGNRNEWREGSGNRKAHLACRKRGERNADARTNGMRSWIHTWAARVIRHCERRNCGVLDVYDLPSGLAQQKKDKEVADPRKGLLGRPWEWSFFKFVLEDKAKRLNLKVNWIVTQTNESEKDQ